ncbi:hypothetical protein HYW42_03790 [Candidatus Daviesbacteria bacterium]|nr:hypothetical protein [Candidatus Daviesbacteria bacterium]
MSNNHDKTLHLDNVNDEELQKSSPELVDEQSVGGHDTNPEGVEGESTVERAHEMGLEGETTDEDEGWMGATGSDLVGNPDDEE